MIKKKYVITLYPYKKRIFVQIESKIALTGEMTKSSLPIRSKTLTVPVLSA